METVYHHFRVWSRSGILVTINARLRRMEGRSNTPSAGVIDSQSVRSMHMAGRWVTMRERNQGSQAIYLH